MLCARALLHVALLSGAALAQCLDYTDYSEERHPPYTNGTFQLSYMRPDPACRTFNSSDVEAIIVEMQSVITDPDLYRLFQNAYPNTLDTAIKWKGYAANNSDEELTFVITGDINAMWLRDSANQMQSYLPVLKANSSADSIASLYRGVINLHTRYILTDPYCNSFQPPVESNLSASVNSAATDDVVKPTYSNTSVFECKYELDSLAAFLEVSTNYYNATQDLDFFGKFQWIAAVQEVLNTANAMMTPTYGANGAVLDSPYTFERTTDRASETLENNGLGSPVANGTGLVRSAFRPSDDSTIFQLFIPANMMFSRYLASAAQIMAALGDAAPSGLADEMTALSDSIRAAVQRYGIITSPVTGTQVYAYEVDGFGSVVMMDDANIPSLLSAPFFGFLDVDDEVYQNTRAIVLDQTGTNGNPYFMRGPVINAVGGPHDGPGFAWPMASIMRIYTSNDEAEITEALGEIVSSTDGLGLIHESINTFNQSDWTRQWFSWANGLFGQMILNLNDTKPEILKQSYQSF
ncbi:hypothetical protein M406DRAFT_267454 [Cryphonectria parasitica EP155]|uniref:Meiotically up-regulated 157 protein n=1 Tax=Cryphonectria parasitica (strain ATCC 38755 / EP155) TaxID=660469 RepID=A0A9P4XU89_CRYP1|nr:uncharacterized protein M406DRAFT_267454 [Cryphonectria parasitica EP155]KAF3761011.1 hypothetical protein M406DRAFT_267454 [Cryphonectria parasitica EP155]